MGFYLNKILFYYLFFNQKLQDEFNCPQNDELSDYVYDVTITNFCFTYDVTKASSVLGSDGTEKNRHHRRIRSVRSGIGIQTQRNLRKRQRAPDRYQETQQ